MHIGIFDLIHPKMRMELKETYVARIIRAFGLSIIGVFIPIYLLNLGYSLNAVLIFLLSEFFFLTLFSFLAAYSALKIGVKHTISIGSFLTIVLLVMLFTLDSIGWPLLLLGFINGLSHALFWIPFNANFVKSADKGSYGKEVGLLVSLPHIIGIIGPLVGAAIIIYSNFHLLVIIACAIVAVSIVPFFLTPDIKPGVEKIKNLFNRRNWNYFDMYVVKGILWAALAIWPLFIFYVVSDYATIGIVDAIKGVSAAIFTFLAGWLCDRIRLSHVFKIAGTLNVVVWLVVFMTSSSPPIFILSFLVGFAFIFVTVPLFVLSTMVAQEDPTGFMAFREVAMNIGRCLVFSLMIFLPFQDKFTTVFLLAAIASVYLAFFRTKRVKF